VALIGVKNMGWSDLEATLKSSPGVRCVGLCDIDDRELTRRKLDLEKLHPLSADFTTARDYRRLLDRKDIDAVFIGTPDHWHCLPFVDACKAGKDIYVQKPLANSIAECDVMVAAARKHRRIVQVGQQQRSGAYWRELVEFVRSGAAGRINRVNVWANFRYTALPPAPPNSAAPAGADYDRWLGPAPARPFNAQRFHGSWRAFWAHGGGLLTDWGVHLLDIALLCMGATALPQQTLAAGGKLASPDGGHEAFDTLSVTWKYPDFLLTWENNTLLERGPFDKNYGIAFWGERGLVVANRSGWEFLEKRARPPAKSAKGDGWRNTESVQNHTANFIDAVRSRNPATACPVEAGALCAKLAHLGNIAARVGTALAYDDAAHRFDNPAADKFLRPDYRAPWKFPEP
jgi:predicted dehydrogenase